MRTSEKIRNAVIVSTFLGVEDHGIFTARLQLSGDGWGQSFGDRALDRFYPDEQIRSDREGFTYGFMKRVLNVLDIDSWERLVNVKCRIVADHTKVYALGHWSKDAWFYPEQGIVL